MQHNSEASFGRGLKAIRKQKKISQAELAEAIGVHTGTVSHWENGRQMPDTATMQKAADFLGVPIGSLLDGNNSESPGCVVDSEAELEVLVSQLKSLSKASLQVIAFATRAAYNMEKTTVNSTGRKDKDYSS